jgi:hypothetical protein
MIKYAPVFLLLAASTVQADGWEWKRQTITPEDRCEIQRIAKLTALSKCELDSVVESERLAFNERTMMQYNRQLPSPQPMSLTPCVPPPARRGIHRFIH